MPKLKAKKGDFAEIKKKQTGGSPPPDSDIPADEVQNQTNARNYTNPTSYKLALLNFKIVMVAIIPSWVSMTAVHCLAKCRL